jgi:anti-sigma factor RsiW
MVCGLTQERIAVLLAGSADERARLQIESHTAACMRCAMAYRDYIATSIALDRAFAPLRHASVALSPARVRLAMRIPEPVPSSVRFSRLVARVNEFALAAAVTAFAFVGAGSVAPKPTITDEAVQTTDVLTPNMHVGITADDRTFIRWFRIGRYATPSDMLDPAVSPRSLIDDAPPETPERAGLLR